MYRIRPVAMKDLDALYHLAEFAEAGLTTFPHDREVLEKRIDLSEKSFKAKAKKPAGELYFFILEDLSDGAIIGTCAVLSKVGGYEPFYTYHICTAEKTCEQLQMTKYVSYLQLGLNHSGPTEVGTLFLNPARRAKGLGRFLSLSRYLFMAHYPAFFEKEVVAELRGVIDQDGKSPFWNALGRNFFDMEFQKADLMAMQDKSFIKDLMPAHPIYISLLPESARNVIGQVHENTKPALKLLESEGYEFSGEVDIFEAGPVMRCQIDKIRTVKESRVVEIALIQAAVPTELDCVWMMARVSQPEQYACVMGNLAWEKDKVILTSDIAEALGVQIGDLLRIATLYQKEANS